jgi:hypothetical protein
MDLQYQEEQWRAIYQREQETGNIFSSKKETV